MDLGQIINLGIYGVFGLLMVFGLIAGFARGIRRQLVRTLTVAAAMVISFAVVIAFKGAALSFFEGQTLGSLLATAGVAVEEGAWYSGIGGATLAAVAALPLGLAILPLAFVSLFIAVSAILLLVHKIICGIVGFTRRSNNFFTRLLGMVIGAAQGAAVAMAILLPVTGLAGAFGRAVTYVEEKYPDKANTVALANMYNGYVAPAMANPAFAFSAGITGSFYDQLSTLSVAGEEVKVTDAIEGGAVILVNLGDLSATDYAYLTDKDKAAIDAIAGEISGGGYMSTLAVGLLNTVGEISRAGGGISTFEEPIGSFMNSYLELLASTDKACIGADVNTTVKVLYLLSDGRALATVTTGGDVLSCFLAKDSEGKTLFAKLSDTLNANARMAAISASVNDMAFSMLLQNNGSELASAEASANVKAGVNQALAISEADYATHEEYRAAVSDSLKATLDDNHISLTDEQLAKMTDYVIVDMAGKTEVSDADMAEFMVKYYEVYAN